MVYTPRDLGERSVIPTRDKKVLYRFESCHASQSYYLQSTLQGSTKDMHHNISNNSFALLLSSIGVGPDSHPGELPPTELMLLGALAIREAQLSNAVQAVDE